jgi:hypothetical protein
MLRQQGADPKHSQDSRRGGDGQGIHSRAAPLFPTRPRAFIWNRNRDIRQLLKRFFGQAKPHRVAAGRNFDANLVGVSRLHVVLGQAFPDLTGHAAHYVVGGGIVVRRPPEHFDSDGALFEVTCVPIAKGATHYVCQEV